MEEIVSFFEKKEIGERGTYPAHRHRAFEYEPPGDHEAEDMYAASLRTSVSGHTWHRAGSVAYSWAHYIERISPWTEREGTDHRPPFEPDGLRRVVRGFDAVRKALTTRIGYS